MSFPMYHMHWPYITYIIDLVFVSPQLPPWHKFSSTSHNHIHSFFLLSFGNHIGSIVHWMCDSVSERFWYHHGIFTFSSAMEWNSENSIFGKHAAENDHNRIYADKKYNAANQQTNKRKSKSNFISSRHNSTEYVRAAPRRTHSTIHSRKEQQNIYSFSGWVGRCRHYYQPRGQQKNGTTAC